MKPNNILLIVLVLLSFSNCIDDKGNYRYADPGELMPVTINGLEKTYSLEMLGGFSAAPLKPVIEGMDNKENYAFTWYVYKEFMPQRDTLSHSDFLDVDFDYEEGTYKLVFEVKDKRTGIYTNEIMELSFSSNFAHGWFVLKDDAEGADIDFVLPDGSVRPNVFSRIQGHPINGNAVRMHYIVQYTHQQKGEDGKVKNLRVPAFAVLSDEDIYMLNVSDMSVYKDYEALFYEEPAVRRPQNFLSSNRDLALINGGKIHLIYGMGSNVGVMNVPISGNYDLHADMLCDRFNGALVFDRTTSSFMYASGFSARALSRFPDNSGAANPSNMNADLIRMLSRAEIFNGGSNLAYALMKNRDKNEYYLADIVFDKSNPFNFLDTIPLQYQVTQADVYGAHKVASCVYFGKGNHLYAHIVSRDNTLPPDIREKALKSFPGETITYIDHISSTSAKDKFEHLIVLTATGNGGWKLYRFALKGNSYEIEPEPVYVYSGQGVARHVLFRV